MTSTAAAPSNPSPRLDAALTCPTCGGRTALTMPTDHCLWFRDGPACATRHRPRPGDCCVVCSYADLPCPPVQLAGRGGCAGPCR